MNEHPIEGLMLTAMNSIKDMIDVDTIIGDPIQAANDITIIPISKVSFGFAAGGSEFSGEAIEEYNKKDKEERIQYRLPFGGGSGAGVTINPIAFLVINQENVKVLPVSHSSAIDKLLDYVPDLIEKVSNVMNKCLNDKKEMMKEKNESEKGKKDKKEINENTAIKKIKIEKDIKKPKTLLEEIDNIEVNGNNITEEKIEKLEDE